MLSYNPRPHRECLMASMQYQIFGFDYNKSSILMYNNKAVFVTIKNVIFNSKILLLLNQ